MKAWSAALALSVCLGDMSARSAELLKNGGFETGDFTSWSVNDPTGFTTVSDGLSGLTARSGTYFAALGNHSDRRPYATISQQVVDKVGQVLTLRYVFAPNSAATSAAPNGAPNQYFDAEWNGREIATSEIVNSTSSTYKEYVFRLTATGMDTLLFREENFSNYSGLDDVSLTTTASTHPLPAAASTLSRALRVGSDTLGSPSVSGPSLRDVGD